MDLTYGLYRRYAANFTKQVRIAGYSAAPDWLTFWFVYSIVAFAKSILDYVSVIIPFYEEAYIGFVIFLGFLGGANMIYSQVLRPFLLEHESLIDAKSVAQHHSSETSHAPFIITY